jgi:hypothetical protein
MVIAPSVNGSGTMAPSLIGGQAASGEVAQANPSQEVILAAGSFVGIGSMNLMVLAKEVNNQRERMTSYVIEAMLDDDAVKPAFDTRKLRALKGPIKFRPSVEDDGDELTDAGADPDEARRAAEFCQDAAKRLPVPLHIWGRDAFNALAFGHKLAEMVVEYVPDGETSGRWTLADLKIKPSWSYHLCTDPNYNLRAVYAQTPQGPAYLAMDHFVVFTWDARDGDPRGSSILRAAIDPWRRKRRACDSRSKGDDQFGTPSIAHELPPNVPVTTNDPKTGRAISTVDYTNQQLDAFAGGSSFTFGNGGDVKVIESQRDGVQISNSIDNYDRAITRAVLLSPKATMESKHYTQGGGEISDDLISAQANYDGEWFLAILRKQVFWRLLAMNWGPAYADLYTPELSVGAIPLPDFAGNATPIAVLGQAGLLTTSQLTQALRRAGVAPPQPGELRIGPTGLIPNEVPAAPEPAARPAPAGDKP